VVYSIDSVDSFNAVNKWMMQIRMYAPESVKVLLLGNKTDLNHYREVGTDVGEVIRLERKREARRSVFRSLGLHRGKCASGLQRLGSGNHRGSCHNAGPRTNASADSSPEKFSYQKKGAAANKC